MAYPDNPFIGQEIEVGGTTKQWNGYAWANITNGSHGPRLNVLESPAVYLGHYIEGDGVTDDTEGLQRALTVAYATQSNLIGMPKPCRTTSTIYIPNFADAVDSNFLDFCGLKLRPDDNVTIAVDSGKQVGNTWESAWDEPNETFMSFLTEFKALSIEGSSDSAKMGRTGIRLKDWHYGCDITKVAVRNFEFGHHYKNCFSASFTRNTAFNTNPNDKVGKGFTFDQANNLIKLAYCWVANVGVGYEFTGGLTAVEMDTCGVEGVPKGVVCTDFVYSLSLNNCYIEKITDIGIEARDWVYSLSLEDCYVNFAFAESANAKIFDFLPSPNNNLMFNQNNDVRTPAGKTLADIMFVDYGIFGYNKVFVERASTQGAGVVTDYVVDNTTIAKDVDWNQKIIHPDRKAIIVNDMVFCKYGGRTSTGFNGASGFDWNNTISDPNAVLTTAFTPNACVKLHVALKVSTVSDGSQLVRGELIGNSLSDTDWQFYELTPTGLIPSNKVVVTFPGATATITVDAPNTSNVTNVQGEIRHIS